MSDYADDAWDPCDPKSWYDATKTQRTHYPTVKKTNQEVFAQFAGNETSFKVGDRVVHSPSGTAGKIMTIRGTKICWKPDLRFKSGGVWAEADKFRFEL